LPFVITADLLMAANTLSSGHTIARQSLMLYEYAIDLTTKVI
jgi:hypothetical protein